jgi:hypothetical protein
MKYHFSTAAQLVVLLALTAPVRADVLLGGTSVTVDGKCNIYGAGYSAPPFDYHGGGVAPVSVAVPSGCSYFKLSTSGQVRYAASDNAFGGDGDMGPHTPLATFVAPDQTWPEGRDLAPIAMPGSFYFLTGVLLQSMAPSAPQPAALLHPDGLAFSSISPGLQQPFAIGDGLVGTDSGANQVFVVPSGATRLFLGFVDYDGGTNHPPGWFDDDSGALDVTLTFWQVPSPSAMALLAVGASCVARRRR